MILSRLSIVNFKNIAQADLSFSPGLNCFLGNNGMGKTNLLDALYYLSFCKSSTLLVDSQNIRHGEDFFLLQGLYEGEGAVEEIYCGMKRRQKKVFKRNKKEYDRLADHIGLIPLVMISPADAELIQGGSEERRRFLDMVISQFDKAYLDKLIRYNKALLQRNTLLKQEMTDPALYEIWEEQMAFAATDIYRARKAFLSAFIPVFQEFYDAISGGDEPVGITYVSHIERGDLRDLLAEVRERDLILGYTSRGVHKDDLEMMLGDYPMKRIGSQGQNKTFLIALKLAQFDYLSRNGHTRPLLLLDDVFDKLDARRMERIIALVSQDRFGQIFVTDTNREYLDAIVRRTGGDYRLFEVENGDFSVIGE
ncbi:MAG TPA: DNA replication/repair protein RecF [Candidatus Caccoplasma merdavium]|nr:DNA replication/repair protein RecF [Candidatus Caccoplasma merdavium]